MGKDPSWYPPGTPFGIGTAPDEPAEASVCGSVNGVSTLVGVKLEVRCGVSTLVGVKSCLSPIEGSFATVGTGDNIFDLRLTDEFISLDDLTRNPLARPGVFRSPDLPLGSAGDLPVEDRGIIILEDGDLEEVDEVIPWRGETRAGDRDPTRDPSLGDFLRLAFCDRETTSAPESLSAGLVSTVPDAGIAKICRNPSPNVAVLEPLPAPLSGTEI